MRGYRTTHRERLRRKVFDYYGRACACCGATDELCIDHVNGDGRQHRMELFSDPRRAGHDFYRVLIRQGFPPGYQVLCRRCSSSKGRTAACRLDHRAEELAA